MCESMESQKPIAWHYCLAALVIAAVLSIMIGPPKTRSKAILISGDVQPSGDCASTHEGGLSQERKQLSMTCKAPHTKESDLRVGSQSNSK
jgi:hypothetical protein